MTAKEHNKLVGIFLLAHGGLQALVMAILCLVYGILGGVFVSVGKRGEEQMIGAVFIGMVILLFVIALAFTLPQIIGGLKLIREKPGARNWGIVGGIISCLSFPLGTAVGVYSLWFLFGDMGKQMYLNAGMPQQMFQQPNHNYQQQPPPPNSWQ